jgi:hypothetical protein
VTAALAVVVAGGLLLLLAEPLHGLVVLAGAGAGALLRPRARSLLSTALLLVGVGVLALAVAWSDPLVAAGGALVTAAATFAAVRSHRWPPPRLGAQRPSDREPTARDTWEALDRGEDPTA